VTGVTPLDLSGPSWRSVINAGMESSFKISRTWDNVQSRFLGLDGLMHVAQPFADFSWVSNQGTDPLTILQFDRFQPSTKLPPIDFPEFTSIDSIDNWTIARVGVHNRLLTRRDDATTPWITLDTYFDFNIDNPYDHTPYSNLFNNLLITPVPWATFEIDSQVPALDKGFTEVDTSIRFQPTSTTSLTLGHRYLNNNPFFLNSSLFTVGAYYRINNNWGVSAYEQYEGTTKLLEEQRYSVYRDLTSWVASFGAIVTNSNGVKEYGVLLTFTLKAFPKLNFDLNFDPAGTNQAQQ
jgi:LPS-assembly protein